MKFTKHCLWVVIVACSNNLFSMVDSKSDKKTIKRKSIELMQISKESSSPHNDLPQVKPLKIIIENTEEAESSEKKDPIETIALQLINSFDFFDVSDKIKQKIEKKLAKLPEEEYRILQKMLQQEGGSKKAVSNKTLEKGFVISAALIENILVKQFGEQEENIAMSKSNLYVAWETAVICPLLLGIPALVFFIPAIIGGCTNHN